VPLRLDKIPSVCLDFQNNRYSIYAVTIQTIINKYKTCLTITRHKRSIFRSVSYIAALGCNVSTRQCNKISHPSIILVLLIWFLCWSGNKSCHVFDELWDKSSDKIPYRKTVYQICDKVCLDFQNNRYSIYAVTIQTIINKYKTCLTITRHKRSIFIGQ
jgi:hypothetical protein